MTPSTYQKLEKIFAKFNESVVTMYSDLLELYPEHKKTDLIQALGITLSNTGMIYKKVQDELFEAGEK
jgi:hypothetical protein